MDKCPGFIDLELAESILKLEATGRKEDAGSLVPTPPPLVDPVDPELSRISRMNGQQLIWIFSCGYRAQKRGRRFWALRMKGVRYGVLCTHPFVLSPTIWSSADALWG